MSNIVIKAENIGKSYIIGHEKRESYTALRDVIAHKARGFMNSTKQMFSGGQLIGGNEMEEFWALKDLNFEIKQGDRVGIIGRNGAGKSTLLKVLSRITEPTTGRIQISGRVASLLEVGTGFHPELSGRENIYLNGAILGMSRAEIKSKFDEIVDFSGVEKFLDTPVKRYSSGMYVRLAFSVAAHLEPEILVVDEVLAVGDAEFQKKCLGKMEDVSTKEGRTVLFVSHNIGLISALCNYSILLDKGSIANLGETNNVINSYYKHIKNNTNDLLIIKASFSNNLKTWEKGSILYLEIYLNPIINFEAYQCDVAIYTFEGVKVFAVESYKLLKNNYIDGKNRTLIFEIENIGLVNRELRVDVGLKKSNSNNYEILVENACNIEIPETNLQLYKNSNCIVLLPTNLNIN
jgi:ABC-type polysaccharide/polyol phosphate transport system ATPase subunit